MLEVTQEISGRTECRSLNPQRSALIAGPLRECSSLKVGTESRQNAKFEHPPPPQLPDVLSNFNPCLNFSAP